MEAVEVSRLAFAQLTVELVRESVISSMQGSDMEVLH